jgi:hypothetical protein
MERLADMTEMPIGATIATMIVETGGMVVAMTEINVRNFLNTK